MIYIICPSHIATGGTELLHQLHYHLRELGVESSMYYIGRFEGSPVQEKFFNMYKPVISSKIVDSKSNILISPESHFVRMFKYIRIRKVCWWLSVDNFCGIVRKNETHINKIKHYLIRIWFDLKAKKFVHFVQSEYAKEYVHSTFGIEYKKIIKLSDYINDDYFNLDYFRFNNKKENQILYNPRKGFEFTKKIIDLMPDVKRVALQGFTNHELLNLYLHSKIYIDFGNHPGKDRIPREAAICGCCIITSKNGSAKNDYDVPIKDKYKFDAIESNLSRIKECINECLNNYENCKKDFDDYRSIIASEKTEFVNQLREIFLSNSFF